PAAAMRCVSAVSTSLMRRFHSRAVALTCQAAIGTSKILTTESASSMYSFALFQLSVAIANRAFRSQARARKWGSGVENAVLMNWSALLRALSGSPDDNHALLNPSFALIRHSQCRKNLRVVCALTTALKHSTARTVFPLSRCAYPSETRAIVCGCSVGYSASADAIASHSL